MIILDTNVLSEPMRPQPDLGVVRWLDDQIVETLHLTVITVAEMRYGIAELPAGRRRTALAARFEDEVLPAFSGRVLSYDVPATRQYAQLRAATRRAGRAMGDLDAIIAAIALTAGFSVATRDVGAFEAAGVDVLNPWTIGGGRI